MGLLQFEVQTHLSLSPIPALFLLLSIIIIFSSFRTFIFDLIFNLGRLWRCNLYDYLFFREIAADDDDWLGPYTISFPECIWLRVCVCDRVGHVWEVRLYRPQRKPFFERSKLVWETHMLELARPAHQTQSQEIYWIFWTTEWQRLFFYFVRFDGSRKCARKKKMRNTTANTQYSHLIFSHIYLIYSSSSQNW